MRATTAGCVVDRDSNVDYSAVRAQLRLLASDNLEFNLSADWTSDHRNPTGMVLLDYRTPPEVAAVIDALTADGTKTRFGVVGLGTASIAAYAKPDHSWTFFEINPAVERVARDLAHVEAPVHALKVDGELELHRRLPDHFILPLSSAFLRSVHRPV